MFVEVKPRTVFFLQTLYFTAFIVTVVKIMEYMILGQLRIGERQTTFAALMVVMALMTLMDTWILALVYIDLPWSDWAVLDHYRKA